MDLDQLKQIAQANKLSQLNQDQRNKFYWSTDWINLKRYVLLRDNFECQVCKQNGLVTLRNTSRLIVHHIYPLEYYPDKRLDESNLLTVCQSCHNAIHFESESDDDEWW